MKVVIYATLYSIVFIGLSGCSTNSPQQFPQQKQEIIASPAARISAGSGAMHTGMSSGFGY